MTIVLKTRPQPEQSGALMVQQSNVAGPFRPMVALSTTPEHDAIVAEANTNGVQETAVGWQQELANKLNRGLIVSASTHIAQAAIEVEEMLGNVPDMGEAASQIVARAVSAILEQGAATIQQSSIVSMQTIGELANRHPTGREILERQRRDREREQQSARPARWAGLVDALLGRAVVQE